MLSYSAKPRPTPPVNKQTEEKKQGPDPESKDNDEVCFVGCQVGNSLHKATVAHPEPPSRPEQSLVASVPSHRVKSPHQQEKALEAQIRKAPVGRTSPLRREMIKKLVDDTRPKPGSLFERKPKSGENVRAFLFHYQAEYIKAPPMKPLRVYPGSASIAVLLSKPVSRRGGEITERSSVASVAPEHRRRPQPDSSNITIPPTPTQLSPVSKLEKSTDQSDRSNVVGGNKYPAKCGDADPADHAHHGNMSDLAGDDDDGDSEPCDEAYMLDGRDELLSPRLSCGTASTSPNSTPPLTPSSPCFPLPPIADAYDKSPRRLHQSGDFMVVDAGGAMSANH